MTTLMRTFRSVFAHLTCHWTLTHVTARARGHVSRADIIFGLACLAALGTTGCSRSVVRISNGSSQAERAISPQAYAAYTRARLQERAGDFQAATASYEEVLRFDSAADEAWIRLGALRCATDSPAAARAFDRAKRLNAESTALFREKALCSLMHRDCAVALTNADAAMRLAPSDPSQSQLAIRIHLTCGSHQEAERLAWSHVAIFPKDTAGWLALADIVDKTPNLRAQVQRRASARIIRQYAPWTTLDNLSPRHAPKRVDLSAGDRVELEHALATSDRPRAQRAARQLGLGVVELIAFAFDLGALDFARENADLAGQIQPGNLGIWLKRLELADRLRDEEAFARLLQQAPCSAGESGTTVTESLLELVARRTGLDSSSKPTR